MGSSSQARARSCSWLRRPVIGAKQIEPVAGDSYADWAMSQYPFPIGRPHAYCRQSSSVETHAEPSSTDGERHRSYRRIPVTRFVQGVPQIVQVAAHVEGCRYRTAASIPVWSGSCRSTDSHCPRGDPTLGVARRSNSPGVDRPAPGSRLLGRSPALAFPADRRSRGNSGPASPRTPDHVHDDTRTRHAGFSGTTTSARSGVSDRTRPAIRCCPS